MVGKRFMNWIKQKERYRSKVGVLKVFLKGITVFTLYKVWLAAQSPRGLFSQTLCQLYGSTIHFGIHIAPSTTISSQGTLQES